MQHSTVFGDWGEILRTARRERWSGRQTTATFRRSDNVLFADSTSEMDGETVGTVVARWLKESGCGFRPGRKILESVKPPRFARPGALLDAAYMDIESAFYSIYRNLEWDIDVSLTARVLMRGRLSLADFPYPAHRLARNTVVGLAVSKFVMLWTDGVPQRFERRGGLWNPHLCAAVFLTLNCCAWKAIELGARYFNQDGCIIATEQAQEYAEYCSHWGLHVRAKAAGNSEVRAAGAYRVGETTSGTFALSKRVVASSCLAPRAWCAWWERARLSELQRSHISG